MLTILPDAAARKPATPPPVLAYLLCIYVHAVLVILLPKTRLPALALLPVTLCLACYCAFQLDFVQWLAPLVEPLGFEAERLRHMSAFYVIIITAQSWRAIEWAIQSKPYRRLNLPEGDEKKLTVTEHPRDLGTVFVDALDLSWNMRGIGWSWTRTPFPVSHEYAPSLYMLFARVAFEWALLDAIHASIILRQPSLSNPRGDTIFDPSLPNPFFRLCDAALTTLSAGIIVFLGIDAGHGSFALLWRGLFRDPAWHWPPLFDAPWFATSIADFWARWHQLFRRQFAFLGGAFAKVTGLDRRVGTLLGAFVLSGILHDLATWGMSREDGAEPLSVSLFFIAMGVGIVVEQIWKPHGFFGWVWTYVWTVGWASRWIDSWARRGLMASMFCPDDWRPGKFLVELAWRTVSDKTDR